MDLLVYQDVEARDVLSFQVLGDERVRILD
jgi:hypothetical protein